MSNNLSRLNYGQSEFTSWVVIFGHSEADLSITLNDFSKLAALQGQIYSRLNMINFSRLSFSAQQAQHD